MTHPPTPTQQETRVNEPTVPRHLLALRDAVYVANTEPRAADDERMTYRFRAGDLRALLAERTRREGLLRTARAWLGRLDSGNEVDDDTIAKLILAIDAEIALPPPPEPV